MPHGRAEEKICKEEDEDEGRHDVISVEKMALAHDVVCLADFEAFARQHLPKYAYEFYSAGANEQQTLRENVDAFKR